MPPRFLVGGSTEWLVISVWLRSLRKANSRRASAVLRRYDGKLNVRAVRLFLGGALYAAVERSVGTAPTRTAILETAKEIYPAWSSLVGANEQLLTNILLSACSLDETPDEVIGDMWRFMPSAGAATAVLMNRSKIRSAQLRRDVQKYVEEMWDLVHVIFDQADSGAYGS